MFVLGVARDRASELLVEERHLPKEFSRLPGSCADDKHQGPRVIKGVMKCKNRRYR